MLKRFLNLFFISVLLLNCEEQLPPRNEPTNVFAGLIQVESKRIGICTDGQPQFPLKIMVGIKNVFDETLENTTSIKITLSIWLKKWPTVRNTITYELINPETTITIDPEEIYWVPLEWNHRDFEGNYVWLSLGLPALTASGYTLEFKAAGTIQIFTNITAVPTIEAEFPIVYYANSKC